MSEELGRNKPESMVFGVSMRGWIALLIVASYCILHLRAMLVQEAFTAAFFTVVGWYFGQKDK